MEQAAVIDKGVVHSLLRSGLKRQRKLFRSRGSKVLHSPAKTGAVYSDHFKHAGKLINKNY